MPKQALKPMTEAQAIAALKRVAARWPQSLRLVHSGSNGGTLSICRVDDTKDDLGDLERVDYVCGFQADSMA